MSKDVVSATRGRLLTTGRPLIVSLGRRLASVLLGCGDENRKGLSLASVNQPRGVAVVAVAIVHPGFTGQQPPMLAARWTQWIRHTITSCSRGTSSPPSLFSHGNGWSPSIRVAQAEKRSKSLGDGPLGNAPT